MGIERFQETVTDVAVMASKWGMGGGTVTTIFGWLTSTGAAVLIGILVTICGFLVNYIFQKRRDKREAEQARLTAELKLAEDRRKEEMHRARLALVQAGIDPT